VSSSSLVRLGALAAVVAAVLLLSADIIDAYNIDAYQSAELNREFLTTNTHAFQSALRLVALGLLLPLGLVGLYARQSEAAGPWGLLEAVMNSITNGLGMRETEIAKEPSRPWNPHFYAVFAQVHNTL
jgi:hypothetical protein